MCKWIITVILMVVLCGCALPTRSDLQEWTSSVREILPAVKEVQVLAEKAAEDGLLNKEEVARVNTNISKVLADVERFNEAVASAETPGEAVGGAIEASRPFNPYADEMTAIFGLATVIGGVLLRRENNQKKKEAAKRQADKEGRELALREIAALPEDKITAPVVKAKMYKAIGDARRGNSIT